MAALVQAFPQQPGTSTMLQTRPSSSSGPFPVSSQPQQHQQNSRNTQMARTMYHGGTSPGNHNHRGHQTSAPVAPYAFTSTPGLGNTASNTSSHTRHNSAPFLRTENRTTSAPSVPHGTHDAAMNGGPPRLHLSAAGSVSTSSSSTTSSIRSHGSKDDSAIPTRRQQQQHPAPTSPRPLSVNFSSSSSLLHSSPTTTTPTKTFPERYRRGQKKNDAAQTKAAAASSAASVHSPGSDLTPPQMYSQPAQSDSNSSLKTYQAFRDMVGNSPNHTRVASADGPPKDKTHQTELAKRYRRRSLGSLDSTTQINFDQTSPDFKLPNASTGGKVNEERIQQDASLKHQNSSESLSSARSSSPSVCILIFHF